MTFPSWTTIGDLMAGLERRDADGNWVPMSGTEVAALYGRYVPSTSPDEGDWAMGRAVSQGAEEAR